MSKELEQAYRRCEVCSKDVPLLSTHNHGSYITTDSGGVKILVARGAEPSAQSQPMSKDNTELDKELREILERLFWCGHQTHKASLDSRNSRGLKAIEDEAYENAAKSIQAHLQAKIKEAERLAIEKHTKAKITQGKRVGKYKILERINKPSLGHTKTLRVECLKCGETMFRTNNRLNTEHRYCKLPNTGQKEEQL